MSLLESLHAEHKARHARLTSPREVAATQRPRARAFQGSVSRYVASLTPLPPPPPPVVKAEPIPEPPAPRRDWLHVESTSFVNMTTPLKIRAIQTHVCTHYRVSLNDILSARRDATAVRPRQVGMYICKALTLASLPQIGQRFGGRDHTTVLHAIRKLERLRQTDQRFASELFSLCHQLGGECA